MNDAEHDAGMAPTPGYRYAELVGSQLFVAGQVPLDGDGNLLALGDPAAQAVACLDNLSTLIGVHGFHRSDIRNLTVYVVGQHQNLLDAWQAVVGWFDSASRDAPGVDGEGGDSEGGVPPATLLGVNLLGYADQLVEIDATILSST